MFIIYFRSGLSVERGGSGQPRNADFAQLSNNEHPSASRFLLQPEVNWSMVYCSIAIFSFFAILLPLGNGLLLDSVSMVFLTVDD